MISNGCFVVFHTKDEKNHKTRSILADNINKVAIKFLDKLETPTIKIVDKEGIIKFLKENKEFKIDPLGWDYSYKTLTQEYDKTLAIPKGWTYGHIGIWASNYTAWKNFLKTNYDYLLLFEDDVILHDNFFDLFLKYLDLLPKDWEVFHQYAPDDVICNDIKIIDNRYPICLPYQTYSNAVYAVSKRGAKKIVDLCENNDVFISADWFFFKQLDLFNIYTIEPNADMGCSLANLKSTHNNDKFFKINNIVKQIKRDI